MNVLTKLGEKGLEYLGAFEELTKQYAPDVINAGLKVIQINAIQSLTFLIMWAALIGIGIGLWKWGTHLLKNRESRFDGSYIPCRVFGIIVQIIGVVGFFKTLLNVWTWVALFDPKLYLAYLIFSKFL